MPSFDLNSPLEQITDQPMAVIEALRVDAILLTHSSRQIGIRRFHHRMGVIRHLAIRETALVEARADFSGRVNQSRRT